MSKLELSTSNTSCRRFWSCMRMTKARISRSSASAIVLEGSTGGILGGMAANSSSHTKEQEKPCVLQECKLRTTGELKRGSGSGTPSLSASTGDYRSARASQCSRNLPKLQKSMHMKEGPPGLLGPTEFIDSPHESKGVVALGPRSSWDCRGLPASLRLHSR